MPSSICLTAHYELNYLPNRRENAVFDFGIYRG